MRRLLFLTALGVCLAGAPAFAGEINGSQTFGCVTAKLQNGQGEAYNLNFVPFGKLVLRNGSSSDDLQLDLEWGQPPYEVCGQIVAPGKGGFFDPPTRVLAESCDDDVTPEHPYQLDTAQVRDVDEAYGRLKITQPEMNHDGGGECSTEPCPQVIEECDEECDGRKGPPPMVRGTGSLNLNVINTGVNTATRASVPIACHPLRNKKSSK